MLVVLLMYPLSAGPLMWLHETGHISDATLLRTTAFYEPIMVFGENSPPGSWFTEYCTWWRRLADTFATSPTETVIISDP